MASLMAQSGYDAIAISETDFFDGPAILSDYVTRLVAASVSAPTFLASKYALYDIMLKLKFLEAESHLY
jgi:hypothetical protein